MLDAILIDIGLGQQDPFPVRPHVEPAWFLFLELGEGEEQDDATGE